MSEERVYLAADPDVGIPEEISSTSSLKMDMIFNKIDFLLKKSMGKQDSSDYQSINLINQQLPPPPKKSFWLWYDEQCPCLSINLSAMVSFLDNTK